MHETQIKILKLGASYDLGKLKLREIGDLIGIPHPQLIKHHIEQLIKRGFVSRDPETGSIKPIAAGQSLNEQLVNIPILGNANCGEATMFAEECLSGYLKVANTLLRPEISHKLKDLFAVKVYGDSMNNASIPTGNSTFSELKEGDYAIIDSSKTTPKTGDYILSVIEGAANIKKYIDDRKNNQVVLISESTSEFPPIHIDQNMNYLVNGTVVQVIKAPEY